VHVSTRISPLALADTPSGNRALLTLIFCGDGEPDEEGAEQWLQTLGTSFEQLGEHFEDPADESEPDIAGMVAKAIVKTGIDSEQNIPVLAQQFSAVYFGAVTIMKTDMAVADFRGKSLGESGAIMLSAFLPKCT
jgi:hypothetical protein